MADGAHDLGALMGSTIIFLKVVIIIMDSVYIYQKLIIILLSLMF